MRRAALALLLTLAAPGLAGAESAQTVALNQKMDAGLTKLRNGDYAGAAPAFYAVFQGLPEADLKRDSAEFYLASALDGLGFRHAAIELYIDIVGQRHSSEMVARSLMALDQLVRSRVLDENRLIEDVIFGNQFGDLPRDVAQFVEYYQAIGELRSRFDDWGGRRLEDMARGDDYYGWRARSALGVMQLQQGDAKEAEKTFRRIVDDAKAPDAARNDALVALARLMYEQKRWDDAFNLYQRINAPLPDQDVVLLEKAWDRVGAKDERRALGMIVGLGAPVYRRLFAPERALIRAFALKRLCQFRKARLAILDFRSRYLASLSRVRERGSLADDPLLRDAATSLQDVRPLRRTRDELQSEKAQLKKIGDRALRDYLSPIYISRLQQAEVKLGRAMDKALQHIADELLRIDDSMSLLDYEIGVGLFRRSTAEKNEIGREVLTAPPISVGEVYYRFDGEYWSDEIQDFSVLVEDRCVR